MSRSDIVIDPYEQVNVYGTTTSTRYVHDLVGAPGCSVTFMAPDAGRVWVTSKCALTNTRIDGMTFQSIEVRSGGSVIIPATDIGSRVMVGSQVSSMEANPLWSEVSDLEPDRLYTVRQMFRVDSGAGGIGQRRLTVHFAPPEWTW